MVDDSGSLIDTVTGTCYDYFEEALELLNDLDNEKEKWKYHSSQLYGNDIEKENDELKQQVKDLQNQKEDLMHLIMKFEDYLGNIMDYEDIENIERDYGVWELLND